MKSRIYLEDLASEGKISAQDINLVRSAIRKGSLFILVGKSGSGKSVISRIFANEIAKETKQPMSVYLDDLELKNADKLVYNGFLKDERVVWKEHNEMKSENWDFDTHSVMIDEAWKGITKSWWLLARCKNIKNVVVNAQLNGKFPDIIDDNQILKIITDSFDIPATLNDYQNILLWLYSRKAVFIYLPNSQDELFSPRIYFLTKS